MTLEPEKAFSHAEEAILKALRSDGYLIVRAYKQFPLGHRTGKVEWNWDRETVTFDHCKVIGTATWQEFWNQSLRCGYGASKGPFYYKVVPD